MKNEVRVAVVQHDCRQDYHYNLEQSLQGVAGAAQKGADVVLLPELNCLPYFCVRQEARNFDLAEAIPGPTTETLANASREHDIVIITSIFEKRAQGLYHNTAVVMDRDGTLAGTYRKMHIPDDPGFNEKYYFTPGDQGFTPIMTSVGKLGVLICWDQWFPEAARLMALAGAECLFYPSAIGWDPADDTDEKDRQRNAWITIQRSHAIANNLPLVCSNRIGFEADPADKQKGTQFWGSGFICGQQGEILAEAPTDKAAVIDATIEPARTDSIRRIWPYFRDRRIDAYQGLTQRQLD